jgi:hypothetical protein
MKTIEEMKKKFGTVMHNGAELSLTQYPFADFYFADHNQRVCYFASAEDRSGRRYRIRWELSPEYFQAEKAWKEYLSALDSADRSEEEAQIISAYEAEYGRTAPSILDDESNACDWDDFVVIPE